MLSHYLNIQLKTSSKDEVHTIRKNINKLVKKVLLENNVNPKPLTFIAKEQFRLALQLQVVVVAAVDAPGGVEHPPSIAQVIDTV